MPVKQSRKVGGNDSESARRRTLASAVVVVSVGLLALLTIPRPVSLTDLPVPAIDWSAIATTGQKDAELLSELETDPLPLRVRAVGELLRRIGKAEAEQSGSADGADLTTAVKNALKEHGARPLLRLRAVQTQLFLTELANWRRSGEASDALRELGGAFVTRAVAAGWVDAERRTLASAAELQAMYRIRFGLLTGLQVVPEFEPGANDWRLYYGFRLRHPEGGSARERLTLQLAYVDGLAKYDLSFPANYARGVLNSQLGSFEAAFDNFRAHLGAYPSGRLAIRAQNGAAGAAAAMLGQR